MATVAAAAAPAWFSVNPPLKLRDKVAFKMGKIEEAKIVVDAVVGCCDDKVRIRSDDIRCCLSTSDSLPPQPNRSPHLTPAPLLTCSAVMRR